MGGLGLIFKLSVLLKDLHELLTVTYGLPVWASYTIFGVSTVLIGILLGVGIVFLSDCIFGTPFQSTKVSSQPLKKESEQGSGEEDDDEKDEEEEAEEKQENKTDQSGVRKRVAATTD